MVDIVNLYPMEPIAMRPDALPNRRAVAMLLLFAAALGGCASSAPPALPLTDAARAAAAFENTDIAADFDPAWWQAQGDPTLQALVAEARRANLDWRLAVTRVEEARAGSRAAASRLAPTVALGATASNERSGLPDAVKRNAPDTRALRAALDLGWEIDVFGAARAAADAARLDADAAAEGADAARLLAAGETARQYIVWQGARARLAQLEALLQAQADTERLTRSREAAGQASRFDIARAAAETQVLAAQLPPLRALVSTTEQQIATLLGRSPSRPVAELQAAGAPVLPALAALAPGQPAQLLARRPDVRAAERQLLAAGARLREARADLLPRFFLAALFGRQDLRLNGLDLAPVGYSNVALAFSLPLFNAGRLRAAQDLASARERAAALQLERSVIGALQEVESSLVALARERERAVSLTALLTERRAALRHAEALRREGQIDLLQLLDVQRGLIAAELALTEHRTQLALNGLQLYRALGGGWQLEGPTAPTASLTPESRP